MNSDFLNITVFIRSLTPLSSFPHIVIALGSTFPGSTFPGSLYQSSRLTFSSQGVADAKGVEE